MALGGYMMKKFRVLHAGGVLLLMLSLLPLGLPLAQEPAGLVTALQGKAQLTRPATPTPVDLRFKEGLFIRDVVDTQEKSLVRILFGGKSTVTVKELSRLEVREETLPGGAARSVHELSSGAILVNVAQRLMRPGDEVQIRTPNAVAAVRGTTISAQCDLASAECIFAVLAGTAVVTPHGQPPLTLTPNTSVSVTGTPSTGVQVGAVQAVTPAQAAQILQEYDVRATVKEEAGQQQTVQAQVQTATQLATAVVAAITGTGETTTPGTPAATTSVSAAITAPVTPTVPTTPPSPPPPEPEPQPEPPPPRTLPGGQSTSTQPFVQLIGVVSSTPEIPILVEAGTIAEIAAPLLVVTDSILIFDQSATVIQGSLTSTTTAPLITIDPSTVTVAGSLVLVQSGGTISLAGPLLDLISSTLITTAGPLVLVETGGTLGATISSASPFIHLNHGTLTSAESLLDLKDSVITLTGPIANLTNTSTLKNSAGPVIKLSGGALTADALISTDGLGNTLELSGTLLDITNATVALRTLIETSGTDSVTYTFGPGQAVLRIAGGTLTSTGTTPLFQFQAGNLITTGDLAEVGANSTLNLGGPLLAVTGGSLALNNVLNLQAPLSTPSGQPLIQVTGGTLSLTGALAALGAHLTLQGSLLSQTGGDVSVGGEGVAIGLQTLSSGSAPLFSLTGGTLMLTGASSNLVGVNGGNLNLGGSLLAGTDATITVSGALAHLAAGGSLANATGPIVKLSGGSLTADALISTDGLGNTLILTGPLLDLTNATVTLRVLLDTSGTDTLTRTLAAGEPVIRLDPSTLTLTEADAPVVRFGVESGPPVIQSGVALIAMGAPAIHSQINLAGTLLSLGGVTLTDPNPQIQLSQTTLAQTGVHSLVEVSGLPVDIAGPFLQVQDSTITTENDLITVNSAAVTSTTTQAAVSLANSSLLTFGSLLSVCCTESSMSLAGSLLTATDSMITVNESVLEVGSLSSTSLQPLVSLLRTPVHAFNTFLDGGPLSLQAPLLIATDSPITVGVEFIDASGSLSSTSLQPLISLLRSPLTIENGAFLHLRSQDASVTLAGPLLLATDSAILASATTADLLHVQGGSFTADGAVPLLQLSGSPLGVGRDLVHVTDLGRLITGGSLLSVADGSTVTTTDGAYISALSGGLVLITGAGVEFGAGANAIHINNATLPTTTINEVPVSIADNAVISLGPNSGLEGLTVQEGGSAIVASGLGTLVTIDPVLLVPTLPGGPILTIQGLPLLDLGATPLATFSTGGGESVILGPPLTVTALPAQGVAQLTGSVVNITDSIVTSLTHFVDVNVSSLAIPGPLLQVTNSTLKNTEGTGDLLFVDAGSLLKTFGTAPLIQIDPSEVKIADFFAEIAGIISLSAPLLQAVDSTLTAGGDFAIVNPGGSLISTAAQPLIQLTNSSLTAFSLLFLEGGTVNLTGGSLFQATNSTLNVGFALIDSEFGGRLISTSSDSSVPLVGIDGGELKSQGHLFLLGGEATDSVTGLGTDKPLQTAGTLIQATNGASLSALGNALRLDTALLEATAPIIRLVGSGLPQASLETGGSTLDLFKSKVTSVGPVVALDNGLINVQNGALLKLTGGSNAIVSGDLLSLINGSKINVLNGPLVRVSGNGSLLDVSGALVNFGGAGDNKIIVNNTIAPTAPLTQPGVNGIGISATAGGSIIVGPNPVQNPGLGTITVTPGGSLIEATNGGSVNIRAP